MVVPVPDTREHLVELIERGNRGEEIVISVNEKTRAKLVRAGVDHGQKAAWIERLRETSPQAKDATRSQQRENTR
jgi:antitoxin (DNA-binding transcriptional repressor) of toxin-antitoxin stability system